MPCLFSDLSSPTDVAWSANKRGKTFVAHRGFFLLFVFLPSKKADWTTCTATPRKKAQHRRIGSSEKAIVKGAQRAAHEYIGDQNGGYGQIKRQWWNLFPAAGTSRLSTTPTEASLINHIRTWVIAKEVSDSNGRICAYFLCGLSHGAWSCHVGGRTVVTFLSAVAQTPSLLQRETLVFSLQWIN